jgi:hypothetical protein
MSAAAIIVLLRCVMVATMMAEEVTKMMVTMATWVW